MKNLLIPFEKEDIQVTLYKSYYLGDLPDYTAFSLTKILTQRTQGNVLIDKKYNPFTQDQQKIFVEANKNNLLLISPRTTSLSRLIYILGFSWSAFILLGGPFLLSLLASAVFTFTLAKFSKAYAQKMEAHYDTPNKIDALPSQEREALRLGVESQSSLLTYYKSFIKYTGYRHCGAFWRGYEENNPTLIEAIQRKNLPPATTLLSLEELCEKRLTRFAPEQMEAARQARNNNRL